MTKLTTVGSKKAAEPKILNSEILSSTTKRSNFDQVAAGLCPHDEAPLLEPVKTKGVGLKLDCSQCGHTWYINKKIKTCGCLTCKGTKRRSMERSIAQREVQSIVKNNGGPFWTRTRDLSLIRNGHTIRYTVQPSHSVATGSIFVLLPPLQSRLALAGQNFSRSMLGSLHFVLRCIILVSEGRP